MCDAGAADETSLSALRGTNGVNNVRIVQMKRELYRGILLCTKIRVFLFSSMTDIGSLDNGRLLAFVLVFVDT